ncbi:ROK family protein [Rhizobium leguminosarum]|uniref:ROK family protein n=1 Tax=Rhizobium leguminosarum TaxID=384 RepID=A0A6P0B3N6_RHILE|nr:ROK family protein [Rhizobium leguminosarum]NEI39381.1 ROK family protein [Rhizobium leguminosarum]
MGTFSNAGEFGHAIVIPNGNACVCGNKGCLETYPSLTSLRQFLHKKGRKARSFNEIETQMTAEDPLVKDWICEAVQPLRNCLSTLENLFEPEAMDVWRDEPNWL